MKNVMCFKTCEDIDRDIVLFPQEYEGVSANAKVLYNSNEHPHDKDKATKSCQIFPAWNFMGVMSFVI